MTLVAYCRKTSNLSSRSIKYRHKLINSGERKHINSCIQCKKSELWVKCCRRADLGLKTIGNVTKDMYICSLHCHNKNATKVSSLKKINIPPWSKSFRTRHRVALSFGRFQFFFFCCVGRSVIDVLSDFQLDSLTFVEVTLYCVHLSLCVVSIFHKKNVIDFAATSWH